eukprot:TRINITY_DN1381_c0_g1_i1.p1 TRINITY_DN1381_c0_g1~~TRINITY_DN1381_c0_g1_i1.p1  ORF type:complete len:910 (-),score=187.53 TRINITY_DN1381_c0_g1_i1:1847-4576(-)
MSLPLLRKTFALSFSASMSLPKLSYPNVRRSDVAEERHGTRWTDPYRWLEDLDSAETTQWVDSQLKLTRSFLDVGELQTTRDALIERFKRHYNYDKSSLPFYRGGNWFYSCKRGLQNQAVMYIADRPFAPLDPADGSSSASADAPAAVFYDVNKEDAEGTTAIAALSLERSGCHYGLIGLREKGSEWTRFMWFDTVSRRPLRASAGASPRDLPSTAAPTTPTVGPPVAGDSVVGKFASASLVQCRSHRAGYFYGGFPSQPLIDTLARRGLWDVAAGGPPPGVTTASTPDAKDSGRNSPSATGRDSHHCLWYHRAGTEQTVDEPVFMLKGGEASWFYGLGFTNDREHVVVTTAEGCIPKNDVYIAAVTPDVVTALGADPRPFAGAGADSSSVPPTGPVPLRFVALSTGFRSKLDLVGSHRVVRDGVTGTRFIFLTDERHPTHELRACFVPDRVFEAAPVTPVPATPADLQVPAEGLVWEDVIPADESRVLSSAEIVGENRCLLVCHLEDVCDAVSLYALDGTLLRRMQTPKGTVAATSTSYDVPTAYIRIVSFLTPGVSFKLDTDSAGFRALTDAHTAGRDPNSVLLDGLAADGPRQACGEPVDPLLEVVDEVKVPGFDASEYKTEQVFFQTEDGARVPIFITHHKSLAPTGATGADVLAGPHPCILYGYGGFDISIQPYFSPLLLPWLAADGLRSVFAVANIRGGSEYGKSWYTSAIREKKHVSWDDFAAAARELSRLGWTAPDRLSLRGGSNGGLLVSSTALRAPDAMKAYVAQVGVFDLTRFHKSHVGHAWMSDYGDPDSKDIAFIATSSPVQRAEAVCPKLGGRMPAGLIVTGDHDDRVSPFHSFKWVSAVQHTAPDAVTLCRLEKNTGHGHGRPTSKILAEEADIFLFLIRALGASWHGATASSQ